MKREPMKTLNENDGIPDFLQAEKSTQSAGFFSRSKRWGLVIVVVVAIVLLVGPVMFQEADISAGEAFDIRRQLLSDRATELAAVFFFNLNMTEFHFF